MINNTAKVMQNLYIYFYDTINVTFNTQNTSFKTRGKVITP